MFQPMAPSFQSILSDSQSSKGKGRAVDPDLEEAFRQAEESSAAGAVVDSSNLEETMDRLRLEQDSKQAADQPLTDFQRQVLFIQDQVFINSLSGYGTTSTCPRPMLLWKSWLNGRRNSTRP